MKRLEVDGDRCAGNGRCYSLAPELVTDDERGYGQVVGDGTLDDGQADQAQRIARACPENAIAVIDD